MVFLFEDFTKYDQASWEKVMTKEGVVEIVTEAKQRLEGVDEWDAGTIESVLREMLEELAIGAAKGLQPIRVAVTWLLGEPTAVRVDGGIGKGRNRWSGWRRGSRLSMGR